MSKRTPKLSANFVPVQGELRQGLLFDDARTTQQTLIMQAADGSRNIAGIAHECGIRRDECEKIISKLLFDGELREANNDEIIAAAGKLENQAKIDEAIQLYQSILTKEPDYEDALSQLAQLLATSAHTKEAASTYSHLCELYTRQGRLGEALNAARRAASLQPGNWTHQNALAELCIMTGRPDEAARTWRAYAKRLSAIDKFDQALMIIDEAEKKLPGNDILLYAEAEILSANERGTGHAAKRTPRVELKPETEISDEPVIALPTAQIKPNNPGQRLGVTAYIIAGAALLIICIAAYVFQIRESMKRAIGDSAGIIAASAQAPLHNKTSSAQNAADKLEKARPFLSLLETAEFNDQQLRVNDFLSKATEELKKQRATQQKIIAEWNSNPGEQTLPALRDLAQDPDTESPAVIMAQELYKKWLKESTLRSEEKKNFISQLSSKDLSAEIKFNAYTKLFLNHPEAFNYNYPQGVKDLTLNSEIRLFCLSYQIPIPFTLKADDKILQPPFQLPLDPAKTITIEHPGFAVVNSKSVRKYTSTMPRPFTSNQIFIVKKITRWEKQLDTLQTPVTLSLTTDNVIVLTAGNKALTFNPHSGALTSQIPLTPASTTGGSKTANNPAVTSDNKWSILAESNLAWKIDNDKFADKPAPLNRSITGIVAAKLASFSAPTLLALELIENNSGLSAYDPANFKQLWHVNTSSDNTATPLGDIFVTGWDIFYVDTSARFHHVLENGAEQGVWPLDGFKELSLPPLFYESKELGTILITQNNEQTSCYKIQANQNPALIKIWTSNHSMPLKKIVRHKNILIGCRDDSNILTVINCADGQIIAKTPAPVKEIQALEYANSKLYLSGLALNAENENKLYALLIDNGTIAQTIWDIPLAGNTAAMKAKEIDAKKALISIISGNQLCLIDD